MTSTTSEVLSLPDGPQLAEHIEEMSFSPEIVHPSSDVDEPHEMSRPSSPTIMLSVKELLKTCVVCMNGYAGDTMFTAQACQHDFCASCLAQHIETCIDNEIMFPPRCCGQVISLTGNARSSPSVENLIQSLDDLNFGIESALGARLQTKANELDVLPKDRLYCPNPRCAVFIGSWSSLKRGQNSTSSKSHQCPACSERVCIFCRDLAHTETPCSSHLSAEEKLAESQVRNLARDNMWQTCPGCGEMVERTEGCNHLVCRCKTEFCYGCGSLWDTICVCRR
ncbi:hypothetical protein BT96DRAFT_104390 [Gymnopus androsaceus JB14]|uniref:RBR-type E3 ubiquitin transferase n=1 Tax=Gymnopus androsaceus JB14 TaxID=1447944 RepID=A0A6A4IA63_9AGAR|nr:hypothetical protein BT96DRAFT_104390 [Gymnopus androsaceus JB14]